MFEEKREVVLAIEAAVFAVDDLNVFGHFGVFRFPPPIPAQPDDRTLDPGPPVFQLSPKVHTRGEQLPNFHSGGLFHRDFLSLNPCKDCEPQGQSIRLLRPRVVR
jgi:hypothetical protein